MLMQIKTKQRNIASITLSLFIGSWLLLLCQTCIAATDSLNNEAPVESTDSCHSPSTDNVLVEDDLLNDEHCPGACDCDAIIITASMDKNSELKEKAKYTDDLYAYISSELALSIRAPPTYQVSTIPERAILPPLQFTSILLI
jgi:hypothetical protein